jgi:hypothetical protein
LGPLMVQPGRGPFSAQKLAGILCAFASAISFGSHPAPSGMPVGCAEQYGRAPGLARYC